MRGLETPGAPIIAPGETYRDAKDPHGAGDLYEVHALQVGMTWDDGWRSQTTKIPSEKREAPSQVEKETTYIAGFGVLVSVALFAFTWV